MKKINKVKVLGVVFLIIGIVTCLCVLIIHQNDKQNIVITSKIKNYQNKDNELLTLVNFENALPEDWQVDLVRLDNNQMVDRRIYKDLTAMLKAAKSEGLNPLICSSYRTYKKQEQLYQNKVNKYLKQGYSKQEAYDKAAYWVAKPNTSEHQLGLAVDIVSMSNQRLDHSQEKTSEQQWLIHNSWRYGFILRYPTNKNSITKVGYEPWHYRYVGKENAKKMNESGVCLEEYIAMNK